MWCCDTGYDNGEGAVWCFFLVSGISTEQVYGFVIPAGMGNGTGAIWYELYLAVVVKRDTTL